MAKKTAHTHCWHVMGSVTNGLGVSGWDREQCCHCGVYRRQHWAWVADPAHGAYAEAKIRRNARVSDDA
jgi:hypothetical protein